MARPKKTAKEILSFKVTIRLNQAAFNKLNNEAQYLGIKPSSLAKKKVTGKQITMMPKAQRTQLVEYARIRALLSKQQRQLEQIAAQINVQATSGFSPIAETLAEVRQTTDVLKQLLNQTANQNK